MKLHPAFATDVGTADNNALHCFAVDWMSHPWQNLHKKVHSTFDGE
jgi:hypothetical protein